MKRFLCWLKFGHVWKENRGFSGRGSTMYQCQHCALTEVFDDVTGERQ